MANWTRRRLTKTVLGVVSAALLLLDWPGSVRAQSCGGGGGGNYNYYDPYDGGGGCGTYFLEGGGC
jgi:hypothetical protein